MKVSRWNFNHKSSKQAFKLGIRTTNLIKITHSAVILILTDSAKTLK